MSLDIRKVGNEWCFFHPSGREVARSTDRALLDSYVADLQSPPPPQAKPEPRAAAPAPGLPLTSVTYTTRARSTGATTSAGRTESGWGSHCLNHGTLAGWENRTVAETQVSRPQEWCPGCVPIAAGDEPKILKNDLL